VRLEAPSYLPGLIAYYRKDYDGALALAGKAHEEAPWFYEAAELQADALLARGISEESSQHDAAARDLEEAARQGG
jgi:tetratricopeptide (TPR) repeat protein